MIENQGIEAENVWWWKKLQPRVSLSGKLLVPKMSLFGIYLVVENTSWWKMFGGPKKLQPLSESEEKHHLGSNLLNYYHLLHVKRDINKRHEYTQTFAPAKVIADKSCN